MNNIGEFIEWYSRQRHKDPAVSAILAGVVGSGMMKRRDDYKDFIRQLRRKCPDLFIVIRALNKKTNIV